ncbi:MAG: hypothetical protein ACE5F9_07995 [Phycisphaerae bacterium]
MTLPPLEPGRRVRVIQHIATRDGEWSTPVEGCVVSCEARPTGSWYAHGKNKRLWLRRLRLEKADGELVDLTLDVSSRVTVIDPTPATD